MAKTVLIGTAGWAVPRAFANEFPTHGTGLQRYAARFSAVEINSTFRRSHMPRTWARWAESVPEEFRFAVSSIRSGFAANIFAIPGLCGNSVGRCS